MSCECDHLIILLIPQGTVDNNLGPDLTVHGAELRLFWAKVIPLLILLMRSSSRYNF